MIFNLIHNASETVGLIGDVLKELRIPSTDVHLYHGDGFPRDTSDLQGLILMGGPMSVNDVAEYPFLLSEIQLIEKLLSEDKPVLGICLGAQLIAKALGSKVYPNSVREVGWYPIQLTAAAESDPHFKSIPAQTNVFHWHGETFDLPRGAVPLARSEKCENQAFRWGESTYGLQFHLEVTPAIVREWCRAQDGKRYAKSAGEDPAAIVQCTAKNYQALEPVAKTFLTSYFKSAFYKVYSLA